MDRKEYHRQYDKKRYAKDPAAFKRKEKEARLAKQKWFLNEIIMGSKCSYCPENDPRCLDFHHIFNNKEFSISNMVRNKASKSRILAELAKCIPLCANCHRKEHHEERIIKLVNK